MQAECLYHDNYIILKYITNRLRYAVFDKVPSIKSLIYADVSIILNSLDNSCSITAVISHSQK